MSSTLQRIDRLLDDIAPTEQKESSQDVNPEKPRFELYYWDIKGIAQPIRYMLAYAGQGNNLKFFGYYPHDRPGWLKVKFTLGLDFPNLPYFIDNKTGLKITQSSAILRYVAKIFNVGASDPSESAYEDMVYEAVSDFGAPFGSLVYSPNFETQKEDFIKGVPDRIKQFEAYFTRNGTNRVFIGGNTPCIADFKLYCIVDNHTKLMPDLLDKFPNLTRFYNAFRKISSIQEYMKTSGCEQISMNGGPARFGAPPKRKE